MSLKEPTTYSARQIAEAIEAVAAILNAATVRGINGCFAHMLKADVTLALDVLSDCCCSDRLSNSKEYDAERKHDCAGMGATEDASRTTILSSIACRNGSSTTADPAVHLGTPVRSLVWTPSALPACTVSNYRAPNMVVAAAGAVGTKRSSPRSRSAWPIDAAPEPEPAHFRRQPVEARQAEQSAHCHRAARLPCAMSNSIACSFSQTYSAGACRSPVQEVRREVQGICYAIHAFHMPFV